MVDAQRLQVGRCMPLSARDISQQRTGGSQGVGHGIGIAAGQCRDAELLDQMLARALGIELPSRASADRQPGCGKPDGFECGIAGSGSGCARAGRGKSRRLGQQQLGRAQAVKFGRKLRCIDLGKPAFATGHDHAGQCEPSPACDHLDCQDRPVFPIGQQCGIGERAGCHQSHHLALDRAFRGGRIAELLADRH